MFSVTRELVQKKAPEVNGGPVSDNTIHADPVCVQELDGRLTYFLSVTDRRDIERLPDGRARDITNLSRLNDVWSLRPFFAAVNEKLPEGGFFTGCFQTAQQRKRRIFEKNPPWLVWPYYLLFFVFRCVFPKLKGTRKLYFALTRGRNRVLSKTEVLGRLVCCGFEIVDHQEVGDELYFLVQKTGVPAREVHTSKGLLLKLRRVVQGGRVTTIYKLRTMHPYAEHLQDYIHAQNNLLQNGKFKDDFRIALWGRFLRRTWIDELPMLVNWVKRDVKLVGVRPLTVHYLSLYPEEFVERRLRHKPGLIPPMYADLPEGFEEIIASEEKYLTAYEAHPLKTDMQYFWRAMYNILIKRARSQ